MFSRISDYIVSNIFTPAHDKQAYVHHTLVSSLSYEAHYLATLSVAEYLLFLYHCYYVDVW